MLKVKFFYIVIFVVEEFERHRAEMIANKIVNVYRILKTTIQKVQFNDVSRSCFLQCCPD